MRKLLRRIIRWAEAPTEAEQRAMGMRPGETPAQFIMRRRAELVPRLPSINPKAAFDFLMDRSSEPNAPGPAASPPTYGCDRPAPPASLGPNGPSGPSRGSQTPGASP